MRSSNPNKIADHIRDSIERAVDDFLSELNTDVKQQTPVRSGYARRQWRQTTPYSFGYSGSVIENRAPYIAILDGGSSRQAPNGIVQPVIQKLMSSRRRKI